MKLLKDVISGDELCTDAFPLKEEGCVYVVEGKMVVESSGGDYGVSANAGDEEGAVAEGLDSSSEKKVVNFVSAGRLQETTFDKKAYMLYIKGYLAKIKAHLEKGNPARVAPFMAEAQTFIKGILGRFDDLQFFTGESMNTDAMIPIVFWKEDGITPMMYLFKDGIEEVKY